MNRWISVSAPLLFLASGCSRPQPSVPVVPESTTVHAPTVASAPTPQPAGSPTPQPAAVPSTPATTATSARHFGEALGAGVRTATLGDILHAPAQFEGDHAFRVEGQVVAVCQHMGCWLEMRDATTQAHVRMHGHSFFVPRDVNGHHAAVQATLVAAHPQTECDETAHAATGQVAAVELDATGVDLLD